MATLQFSFNFNKAIVAKLSEHFPELQRDEQSAWQRIALELAKDPEFEDVELQCWKELRKYFKTSLVFQIRRRGFSDDQELIDRLQYPYLRKVYSITVSFLDKAPAKKLNRNDNISDNALFIKSVIDGTYDPAVVAAYKRRAIQRKRVSVCINVNDPRYRLSADQRELLMQIEQNRTRKANKRGRQAEVGTWIDVTNNSLPVIPVATENAVSPMEQASNGSAQRLLDEETLDMNTQEFNKIIKDSLDPELPAPPKRRSFTVDSNVDSDEDDELDVSSASKSSVRNEASAGSECEEQAHSQGADALSEGIERKGEEGFVFVALNETQTANVSMNASRDPLQTSIQQQAINSSQAPTLDENVDGRGAGAGEEKDSTTSEPLFSPSSGESAKTATDQTVEPEETVAESQPPPLNEPQIVPSSADAIDMVEVSDEAASANVQINTVSVPIEIARKYAPSIAEEADQSEVPQQHDKTVPERSTAVASEPVVAATSVSMQKLMAYIEVDTDSEGDNEGDSPTVPVKAAVANSNTGHGSGSEVRSASSSDTVSVARPSDESASTVAEVGLIADEQNTVGSTSAEKVADMPLVVATAEPDQPEVPELCIALERTNSVEDGSARVEPSTILGEDLVFRSQPPTLILQEETTEPAQGRSTEVKEESPVEETIPESLKSLMAFIEADTDSEDDNEGDSPVKATVLSSNTGPDLSPTNQNIPTIDQVRPDNEARSASLSDTERVAQPSDMFGSTSVVINVGSTCKAAIVEKSTVPKKPDQPEASSILDGSTAEPEEDLVSKSQPRTLILQEETSEPVEGSRRSTEVIEEPPEEESIPECMKNLMDLIEADTDSESENESDAAHVARPSDNSTSTNAKIARSAEVPMDSHIEETGRPVGAPAAVQGSSEREGPSASPPDAVTPISVEPIQPQQSTTESPTKTASIAKGSTSNATLPEASSVSNNSSQGLNHDRAAAGVPQTAVVEDQIVPRAEGESVEMPQVPSMNVVGDSMTKPTLAQIQPSKPTQLNKHRWVEHHRALEPFVRSHTILQRTMRQQWPQLFQRTPTTQFSDFPSLNNTIKATVFNAIIPTDALSYLALRTMVEALAFRITLGMTPQELCLLQQAATPRRSPLVQRNWEIIITKSEDGVSTPPPPPKRIKISETGESGFSLQNDWPVVICLSDSEDSPTLRLPVRRKRCFRVRQN